MTMNSRWRSLFFSFTNAPATGFPDASCTTPSRVELFSAAHANWLQSDSKAAAKPTMNFKRILLSVIPDLLVFLAVGEGRARHERCFSPEVQQTTCKMCVWTKLFAEYTPIRFRSTHDF